MIFTESLRCLRRPVPFLLLLCEEQRVFSCRWQQRSRRTRVDECGGRLRICRDDQHGDDAQEESRAHRQRLEASTRKTGVPKSRDETTLSISWWSAGFEAKGKGYLVIALYMRATKPHSLCIVTLRKFPPNSFRRAICLARDGCVRAARRGDGGDHEGRS